ncbi:MAG: acyltransferase [Verrucomicrobia bacterium]|nr:acyltransferase [Verrucomicrobiota bacterium]
MNRVETIWRRYGWRAPFVVLVLAFRRWVCLRERFVLLYIKCCTKGRKGRRIRLGRDLLVTPGGFLSLGDDSYLGDRCMFEIDVNPEARVTIGNKFWINRDFHLHSGGQISIGNNVLIGEFVSIRDTTHVFEDPLRPTKEQPDVSSSIIIEDDVWIGRGSLIQTKPPERLVIGRGAVIGANTVVTTSIPAMEIWAGAPARLIRRRIRSGC